MVPKSCVLNTASARKVGQRADAVGPEIERAGLGLGKVHEISQVLDRQAGVDEQHARANGNHADW
jgi:hypothetical protein